MTYAQKLLLFLIFNIYLTLMPPEEPAGTEWKLRLSPALISHTPLSELNSLHRGERMEDHKQQNNKSTQITSLTSKHNSV